MRKMILLCSFALLGSFALANENSNSKVLDEITLNSEVSIKNITISPEGICWVDIYYQGVYQGTLYSEQPNADACRAWIIHMMNQLPAV